VRVAGVEAAGDIGRGHQAEQGLVGFRISLTDIGVQVDLPHLPIVSLSVRLDCLFGR
jgi:hypothetical protein